MVSRVYVRTALLPHADLHVPCRGLSTIGDVRVEAQRRLRNVLHATVSLRSLRRRDAGDNRPLYDSLTPSAAGVCDGDLLIAEGDTTAQLPPHVRLHHPLLNERVVLFVPLGGCDTVADVVRRADELIKTEDPTVAVAGLSLAQGGHALDGRRRWRKLFQGKGEYLYALAQPWALSPRGGRGGGAPDKTVAAQGAAAGAAGAAEQTAASPGGGDADVTLVESLPHRRDSALFSPALLAKIDTGHDGPGPQLEPFSHAQELHLPGTPDANNAAPQFQQRRSY